MHPGGLRDVQGLIAHVERAEGRLVGRCLRVRRCLPKSAKSASSWLSVAASYLPPSPGFSRFEAST